MLTYSSGSRESSPLPNPNENQRGMAGGRLSFDRLPWCTGRVLGRAFLSPQVAERTRLPRERASEVPRHARLGNGENHAETQLDRQSAACWWVARHPTFTYLGEGFHSR